MVPVATEWYRRSLKSFGRSVNFRPSSIASSQQSHLHRSLADFRGSTFASATANYSYTGSAHKNMRLPLSYLSPFSGPRTRHPFARSARLIRSGPLSVWPWLPWTMEGDAGVVATATILVLCLGSLYKDFEESVSPRSLSSRHPCPPPSRRSLSWPLGNPESRPGNTKKRVENPRWTWAPTFG